MSRQHVDPAANLRLTFELFEFGVEMMRQKLKRKSPTASEEEVQRQLEQWLSKEDEA